MNYEHRINCLPSFFVVHPEVLLMLFPLGRQNDLRVPELPGNRRHAVEKRVFVFFRYSDKNSYSRIPGGILQRLHGILVKLPPIRLCGIQCCH